MRGGIDTVCQEKINGTGCSDDDASKNPKKAFPDLDIFLSKHNNLVRSRIVIEFDENRHTSYRSSCELKRLELLHYGIEGDVIFPTLIIRFNPHNIVDQDLPDLQDRMRELLHVLRCELKEFEARDEDFEDCASHILTLQYMFYGNGNVHRNRAGHATMSLCIREDINNSRAPEMYDDDIGGFTFADLDAEVIQSRTSENAHAVLHATASPSCCKAETIVDSFKKQCSSGRTKGSDLCKTHWAAECRGEVVPRFKKSQ